MHVPLISSRAFSTDAPGDGVVDAVAGALASDGSGGVGGSTAAIDEGVSYPLWFLDQEGWIYQAIMSANDVTASWLTTIHDSLHLPWWGTIVAATLMIRVVMLPLNIYAVRNTSRCVPVLLT